MNVCIGIVVQAYSKPYQSGPCPWYHSAATSVNLADPPEHNILVKTIAESLGQVLEDGGVIRVQRGAFHPSPSISPRQGIIMHRYQHNPGYSQTPYLVILTAPVPVSQPEVFCKPSLLGISTTGGLKQQNSRLHGTILTL